MSDQLDLFSTPAPPAELAEAADVAAAAGEPFDVDELDPWGTILACLAYAQGLDAPILQRIRELGRLPHLADDVKPWTFAGWLLPMVIDPRPESRWYWWLETNCARRPLRPMPQADFHGENDKSPAYRNVAAAAGLISRSRDGAPGLLIEWLAWGLGVAGAELPQLEPETCADLYRAVNLDLWRERPSDYLGMLMCEYKGRGYDPAGFFPTPMELCTTLAALTIGELSESREPSLELVGKTVLDPAVGTGRLLLVASNWCARLSGMDIQRRCVLATLVNGAVYAPWMAWPFPDFFFRERAA